MPGAPNRPPEMEAPPPSPTPSTDSASRHVLRRLAPARVALRLDVWKGAPHADLLKPFERAETAFGQSDFSGAESALDQLSIRFAEPRWPTMPLPFRELRVVIVAPQPPQWDPEFTLTPPERDERKAHRDAEKQLALARGAVAWANSHGIACDDLANPLAIGDAAFAKGDLGPEFWDAIDQVWSTIHERVPLPGQAAPATVGPPAPAVAESADQA